MKKELSHSIGSLSRTSVLVKAKPISSMAYIYIEKYLSLLY